MKLKVEIGQFRKVDKGALKAFFTLVIYPEGQKITDCRYFELGGRSWIGFPQKERKYDDGRATEYFPYISYLNKEYLKELNDAAIEQLQTATEETHGQNKSKATQKNPIQGDTPELWF